MSSIREALLELMKRDNPHIRNDALDDDENPQSSFLLQAGAVIGLSLTATLWLVSSYRLASHFIGWTICKPRDFDQQGRLAEGIMRRMFHILLWVSMLVELLGYLFYSDFLNIGFYNEMKIGYALVSTFGKAIFEFNAFAVVTLYWFKSMAKARAGLSERKIVFRIYPALLLFASITLASHSLVEIVDLFGTKNPYPRLIDFKKKSPIHRHQLVFGAFAWGLHGLLVIVCGVMMYKRLSKLPLYDDLQAMQKAPIMTRIMVPIALCSSCYIFRGVLLMLDYIKIRKHGDEEDVHFEEGPFWWIFAEWVPSMIPAYILLYALRKRDRTAVGFGGPGEALLPQPTPPEEVFRSFKHSIYNEFNESDGLAYLVDNGEAYMEEYSESEATEDELPDIHASNTPNNDDPITVV